MTVGFDRLPVQESCSTLPTAQLHEADALQAPVTDGGFLNPSLSQFLGQVLTERDEGSGQNSWVFSPRPAYDTYLQMDKVLARSENIADLVQVHDDLKDETMPRYLAVAGWAAAEAALMGRTAPKTARLELLKYAEKAWAAAVVNQVDLNRSEPHLREPSQPLRLSLDLAILPLLEGMVRGDVTIDQCTRSFEASLEIATYNREFKQKAKEIGDIQAMQDYSGFSYELLCLLAVNRRLSSSKFAIPGLARADSGHYLQQQTHDLLSVHQQWGVIRNAVPIEIKGQTSGRDRRRYKALLIRGQTYLCQDGLSPDETLEAIKDAYIEPEGKAAAIADALSGQVTSMIKEYSLGGKIDVRARKSVTYFRDNARVLERFPGLQAGQGHLLNAQVSMG